MPLVLAGGDAVNVGRGERTEGPRSEAHDRARKIRPELTRGELVRVAGGRNQAEAELIQGLLLEEGIPSLVRRAAAFDVPDFLAAGQRDVLVPESGAAMARELLAEATLVERAAAEAAPVRAAHVVRLVAAITAGALLAASIAWVLVALSS
jgi:hypothetical protein